MQHQNRDFGRYICKWLRMHGRVPANLILQDNQKAIVSISDEELTLLVKEQKNWFVRCLV
jgi:hypothetical protein